MDKFKRLFSIDVLRALAILFMVQGHFMYYWTSWDDLRRVGEIGDVSFLRFWVDVDNFSAPVFTFLAGFSIWFWIRKNSSLMNRSTYTWKLFKRGLVLFFCGFAITYLAHYDLTLINILHVTGVGIMLLAVLHRLPLWCFGVLIIAILLIAPLGQAWSQYAVLPFDEIYWPTKRAVLEGWAAWQDSLINYAFRGYQAFIPWLIFPLYGFFCARLWFGSTGKNRYYYLLILGLSCLAGSTLFYSGILTTNPYLSAFNYYPLTTPMALASLGVTVLSILGLYYCLDYKKISLGSHLTNFFKIYSRFSLTVYVAHNLLLLGIFHWGRFWWEGNPWAYYADLMTVSQALLLAWVFILLFYVLIYFWYQLNGGKYSLEWWLRYLSTVKLR